MQIALFQPDIPQNVGGVIRLCSCMGLGLNIIRPCGFVAGDKNIRKVALDYAQNLEIIYHDSWNRFLEYVGDNNRIILLTTKAELDYTKYEYSNNSILLLGRESCGVPSYVHDSLMNKVTIPMVSSARSLNIVVACAMVTGEAVRQINLT